MAVDEPGHLRKCNMRRHVLQIGVEEEWVVQEPQVPEDMPGLAAIVDVTSCRTRSHFTAKLSHRFL
eukprot:9171859-Lingulodinium_polyedra.AAC.1